MAETEWKFAANAKTAKTIEHSLPADEVLEAAQTLAEFEPGFGRPGRKLGL
jgi:hypothetical protein